MRKRMLLLLGALVLLLSSCAPRQTADVPGSKAGSMQVSSQTATSAEASSASSQISSVAASSKVSASKASSKIASSSPKVNTSSAVKPNDTPPPVSSPGQYQKVNALTAAEKLIYNKLYNAAQEMVHGAIDLGKLDNDDAKAQQMVEKALSALRSDFPEIFWLPNKYFFLIGGYYDDESVLHVTSHQIMFQGADSKNPGNTVDYPVSKAERDSFHAAMNTAVNQILGGVPLSLSEYERELRVFKWLCENVSYDHATLEKVLNDEEVGFKPFTAYGAIVEKKAVCEGYSRAFQLLMQKLNIESALITGRSARPGEGTSVGHMWNVVKIDGKWYQLDVTWADQDAADSTGAPRVNYEFFNTSDTIMRISHQYDPIYPDRGPDRTFNLNLPACSYFDDNNYFVRNGMYIKASDDLVAKASEVLKAAAQSGQKHAWLMFENKTLPNTFWNKFSEVRTKANEGLPINQKIGTPKPLLTATLGAYVSW